MSRLWGAVALHPSPRGAETLWPLDSLTLLKITEDPKELLFHVGYVYQH